MRLLITNIGILAGLDKEQKLRLCGSEMKQFSTIENAWLLIEDSRFKDWGKMSEMPSGYSFRQDDRCRWRSRIAIMVRPTYTYRICRKP